MPRLGTSPSASAIAHDSASSSFPLSQQIISADIASKRSQRLEARFPLRFVSSGDRILGECVNLSESGLLGRFYRELELWSTGVLTLRFPGGDVDLEARVARVDCFNAGFSFLFRNNDTARDVLRSVLLMSQGHAAWARELPPF